MSHNYTLPFVELLHLERLGIKKDRNVCQEEIAHRLVTMRQSIRSKKTAALTAWNNINEKVEEVNHSYWQDLIRNDLVTGGV